MKRNDRGEKTERGERGGEEEREGGESTIEEGKGSRGVREKDTDGWYLRL